MSSILEALKKVEKESPNLDFTPDLTKGMDARKAVSRRARDTRIVYRIATSLVVLIVLGIGGWLLLARGDLFRKDPVDHITPAVAKRETPVTPPVNTPVRTPGVEKTVEVPKVEVTKELPSPAPVVKRETSSIESVNLPAQTRGVERTVEIPKEEAPREMPPPVPGVKIAGTGAQETPATKPVTEEKFQAKEPPKPRELTKEAREHNPDAAKFKLEAIVWSESPAGRFAVINGQIVRAGGSLEGISVTSIARDHVAVRSSGREWNLTFVAE